MDSFDAIDSWSWKIMEFAKIWPLTCHNWVKYWPRTKNNTTNREYSARANCWSFPRSSTTLRLETPRGVAPTPPPPLHRRRWQNTVYGRGLSTLPPGMWNMPMCECREFVVKNSQRKQVWKMTQLCFCPEKAFRDAEGQVTPGDRRAAIKS